MQTIPAGFFPDEWNQTFGAFKRLVEQLAEMQAMLTECGELTPENCDVAYIREQVTNEVDTLEFMAIEAGKHWKSRSVAVASAAGQFNLNRPVGFVAWCEKILDAAWRLGQSLRRELAGKDHALCVQRLPVHLGSIPNDIDQWQDSIRAELRAGELCSDGEEMGGEVESDFTEPLPKEFVAHMFKKSTDWLREQIDDGAIRVHSETSRTARKARFHIDTVPMLKHAHDRARLLLEFQNKKGQSRRKAD